MESRGKAEPFIKIFFSRIVTIIFSLYCPRTKPINLIWPFFENIFDTLAMYLSSREHQYQQLLLFYKHQQKKIKN